MTQTNVVILALFVNWRVNVFYSSTDLKIKIYSGKLYYEHLDLGDDKMICRIHYKWQQQRNRRQINWAEDLIKTDLQTDLFHHNNEVMTGTRLKFAKFFSGGPQIAIYCKDYSFHDQLIPPLTFIVDTVKFRESRRVCYQETHFHIVISIWPCEADVSWVSGWTFFPWNMPFQ